MGLVQYLGHPLWRCSLWSPSSSSSKSSLHVVTTEILTGRPLIKPSLESSSSVELKMRQSPEGTDDFGLENFDDFSDGYEIREMERGQEKKHEQFRMMGYRDGIFAGQEAVAQEGFNIGFNESVLPGYKFGLVRGVSSALAFLRDESREKLINEQETGEKFQKLHNSVQTLSSETAIKLFYGTLTTKQGKEGHGSGSGDTNSPYVSELSYLLDKSPKIEVKPAQQILM